jgi:hypothetical protein
MTSRRVVRTQLMPTTIHTVTAADALALRPLLQPVPLPATDRTDVAAEGGRLIEFLAPGRLHDVRFLDSR